MSHNEKILITGATDGIGQIAAIELARGGADLVLIARSKMKAEATCALIRAAGPETRIDVYYCDFTDLASVVAAGRRIVERHPHIDVLINNAGVHAFTPRVTQDGSSEMISVDYFAPWLLTNVLRDTLIRSSPARIVTVGSEASRQSGGLNIDQDLTDVSAFTARGSSKIYGRSKMLDIMFSLELARQLTGTGAAVNCLDPGFNVTSLGRELGFSGPLSKLLNWLNIGNPERGARIILNLALDPAFGIQTGAYISVKGGADLAPAPPANSEIDRRELWKATELLLERFL